DLSVSLTSCQILPSTFLRHIAFWNASALDAERQASLWTNSIGKCLPEDVNDSYPREMEVDARNIGSRPR
ncbi:Uncharacterized protein FKW44_011570, partial [Caligus rogercresseyi]